MIPENEEEHKMQSVLEETLNKNILCPLYCGFCRTDCGWWCAGEKECAVKVIALELIKIGERG